jgi:mannose-1-phosphate guanylyltransferase/phosphomannomutase
VHAHPEVIKGHFGDGSRFGIRLHYFYEPVLLGTAGTVRKIARDFSETFLIYYGDNLCKFDLQAMVRFHKATKAAVTLLTGESYDALSGGVVVCDKKGRITEFQEKPRIPPGQKRLENGGVYLFEPDVVTQIPETTPCDIARDIFPALLQKKLPVFSYQAEGFVRGIDTIERYERVQREIKSGLIAL